jgi:hypothetical protein
VRQLVLDGTTSRAEGGRMHAHETFSATSETGVPKKRLSPNSATPADRALPQGTVSETARLLA